MRIEVQSVPVDADGPGKFVVFALDEGVRISEWNDLHIEFCRERCTRGINDVADLNWVRQSCRRTGSEPRIVDSYSLLPRKSPFNPGPYTGLLPVDSQIIPKI